MKQNHLQRLLLPPGNDVFNGIVTFSGITKEGKERLFKIANFDYMGVAEFELGVIPKSLFCISEDIKKYSISENEIKEITIKGTNFFTIVPMSRSDRYRIYMEDWVNENYYYEYHGLKDVVNGRNERNIQGWLDIEDNVLFFINEEMAKKMFIFLNVENKL